MNHRFQKVKMIYGLRLCIIYCITQGIYGMPECINVTEHEMRCMFCGDVTQERILECTGGDEVIDIKTAALTFTEDGCPSSDSFTSDDLPSCSRYLPLATCHGNQRCRIDVAKLFAGGGDCDEADETYNTLYLEYSCRKLEARKEMAPSGAPVIGSTVHLVSPDFPCGTPASQEHQTVCRITAFNPSDDTSVTLTAKQLELPRTDDCSERLILRRNDTHILEVCNGLAVNLPSLCLPFNDEHTTWEFGYLSSGTRGKFWIEFEGIKTDISVSCSGDEDTQWLHSNPPWDFQDEGLWRNEDDDWESDRCGNTGNSGSGRHGWWRRTSDLWYPEGDSDESDDAVAAWPAGVDYSWSGQTSDACTPLEANGSPHQRQQPQPLLAACLVGSLVLHFLRY